MAYTFGGATSDDMSTGTGPRSMWANGQHMLISVWCYPTTLTTGRYLIGAGTTNPKGVVVDTTTSEIRMIQNNATTNGEWTTTGCGLTVNEWSFLSVLSASSNSGTAFRVWSGTLTTRPVELTVTQAVAPSGNVTSSSTWVLGNQGTSGTVAWQGDIGWMSVITDEINSNVRTALQINSTTAITNEETERVYNRIVYPAWCGRPFWHTGGPQQRTFLDSGDAYCTWDLSYTSAPLCTVQLNNANSGVVMTTPTINGASKSQNRVPRPLDTFNLQPLLCRR